MWEVFGTSFTWLDSSKLNQKTIKLMLIAFFFYEFRLQKLLITNV